MDLLKTIVQQLPYSRPFLFVDELTSVNENGCEGFYTFREDEYFYQGHFKNHPVTPGVILTECMAQIGLVCLGIYLVQSSKFKVEGSKLNVESERLNVEGEKFKVKDSVTMSDSSEAGSILKGENTKFVTLSAPATSRSVSKAGKQEAVRLSGVEASKGEAQMFVFSESNVLFEKPVYPGEKVKVVSHKIYLRLRKLKCRVEMFNEEGERVCFGELSGIIH